MYTQGEAEAVMEGIRAAWREEQRRYQELRRRAACDPLEDIGLRGPGGQEEADDDADGIY